VSDLEPGVQLTDNTIAAMERLSTSPSKPAMTEIEELRTRVEALEATKYAHRPSHLTDAERDRICQGLSRPATWQPLKIATETTYGTAPIVVPSPAGLLVERVATDAELCQVYNDAPEHGFGPALRAVYDLGRQHAAAPIRSGPESPLVERVADAIAAQATSAGIVNDRPARAAILEVAAAALQMHPDKNLTWERVAMWLEQEANQ
jgi:hypothetical protein